MTDLDYKKTGFVIIKPPTRVISYHIIKNSAEHQKLAKQAIDNQYCLYHAPIIKRNGKYIAIQPWTLDEKTIPKFPKQEPKEQPRTPDETTDKLCCPHCGKKCSSKSGLTLHTKNCKK